MKNCFVKNLKGSFNNDDLLGIGEIRFKAVRHGVDSGIQFQFSDRTNHPVTCVSGTIVSQTFSGITLAVVVTEGTIISVENKYLISSIMTDSMTIVGGDIESLLYSADNLGTMTFDNGMGYYNYSEEYIEGDITPLFEKFANSTTVRNQKIHGSIDGLQGKSIVILQLSGNKNIKGSLAKITSPTIRILNLMGTQVTGNLSDIQNRASLQEFYVPEGVNGSIDTLSTLPTLFVFTGYGFYSGDLSSLPSTMKFFISGAGGTFTWSNVRPAASNMFSIGRNTNYLGTGINLGADLDTFLGNIVNCALPNSAVKINVNGTETSSTNALAAALKAKIQQGISGGFLMINGRTI